MSMKLTLTYPPTTCNRCGINLTDPLEAQEMLHKHDVGGFGSVIGDGQEWSVTLCQDCVHELLKPYIKLGTQFY